MNFALEGKGYCNNEEEEEEEEEVMMVRSETNYKSRSSKGANFDFDKKLDLMDLSLASANNEEQQQPIGSSGGTSSAMCIEKEHMFDKVVTPSDVGKLNRLVIPKQHAERFFPLDSSSNEKGLLLNFEDQNGKLWRFRYSYWNSSQSYVMTKGWSRFVKEKKLDAGDIVSFQRGVGELGKDRLFIDWRRRPDHAPDPTSVAHFHHLQNHFGTSFPHQSTFRWGRLYSLPPQSVPVPVTVFRNYEHLQPLNYGVYPYHHHHRYHHHQQQEQHEQQQQQPIVGYGNAGAAVAGRYYIRSSEPHQIGAVQEGGGSTGVVPFVFDSVPIVHGKSAGKRLRLFGVNMECSPTEEEDQNQNQNQSSGVTIGTSVFLPSSSLPPLLPNTAPLLSTMQADQYSKKGKSSLTFDLDL